MGVPVKDNLLRAIAHNDPDHVPYFAEGGIQGINYRGAMPPEAGLDIWGVRWEPTHGDLLSFPIGHPVQKVEDLAVYPFPDPRAPGLFDDAKAKMDKDNCLVVGRHILALFERYEALCGIEKAFTWMLDYPQEVGEFLDRLADWQIAIAAEYINIGVEAGRISDDYGTQRDLLMSPATWRRLIKPPLSRIVQCYKNAGLFVFLHSCGNIMRIMGDLVEIGVDVFNIQTGVNDLPALKRRFGQRITFMGGVDTQYVMTSGTPAEVRQAALDAIRQLGADGGLILGPDQHITMPPENVQELITTARKWGRYPRLG